ncbi:N-6 DNA methylase [Sorangium sp. So ce1014]|uniref:HsdM family class I SAM-dependent methyltransferase n=1 Tax=Sorangium sp. So ce1014 TaxID=3133326 RepID=UPI003F5E0A1E
MHPGPLTTANFFSSDGAPLSGLVPVRSGSFGPLSIDEQAAVQEAAAFRRIDYVFFRKLDGVRSSRVAAYVIDNTKEPLRTDELAVLHKELWRHGAAPLVYVAWQTRIDVLTCARGPDFWKDDRCEYNPAVQFDLAISTAAEVHAELASRFSAYRLSDGTFWDDPRNAKLANYQDAAHQSLIGAIVDADEALGGERAPVLRRLLLLTVLVKYLEDRRVFPEGWFGRFTPGAVDFLGVLREKKPDQVQRLLGALERKFNGDIFVLPDAEGSAALTPKALVEFSTLVEARTLHRQRYLWEQYSFEHLPVEVVSQMYQHFVQGGHGTVYTPPFLASLVLDHVLPYQNLNGTERILDPSCGSGVFLVGAFRRLVNAWRAQNGWQKPDVATLKTIVGRSIFGIDLDSSAIDLAAFSLTLAVCDALKPDVIWNSLKFDGFRGRNLFHGDFFTGVLAAKRGERVSTPFDAPFDVVVGNPPFESKLTDPARKVDALALRTRHDQKAVPDGQAAYLFLEQSIAMVSEGGKLCLIQPAGLLYNSSTYQFRKHIFGLAPVRSVLDFVSIRGLFAPADTKALALLVDRDAEAAGTPLSHLTFRRTFSVHQRIGFELDHYDYHEVSRGIALDDQFVWRANLLGGGRLAHLSRRLRAMQRLGQHMEDLEKQDARWDYGEGFVVSKKRAIHPAEFLTGLPFLPTKAFTANGIDRRKIGKVEQKRFRNPYSEKRYAKPLILIKAHMSLPVVFWDESDLAYRDKIVGIHAPPEDHARLQEMFRRLKRNHRTYVFACVLNGSQLFTSKATAILKQDIDNLPYPDDASDLRLAYWERILREDTLQFMTDFVRLGQDSVLLKEQATRKDLARYAVTFRRLLGTVYDNLRAGPAVFIDGLICQSFHFGEKPEGVAFGDELVKDLHRLIYWETGGTMRTVRSLRFYVDNVLHIIKPDRRRYWIRSTAVRDADETLFDLREQGF